MKPGFWFRVAVGGCLGVLLATPTIAKAADDLDVTMRMVRDNDELTESVVREIELREPVALERRNSESGKPAGTPGEAHGSDKAREARDRGREAARAAVERAREVREQNKQRGRPEKPERPDRPNRPEKPELP